MGVGMDNYYQPYYYPEDWLHGYAGGAEYDCNHRWYEAIPTPPLNLVNGTPRKPRRTVIRSSPAPRLEAEIRRWARRWIHDCRVGEADDEEAAWHDCCEHYVSDMLSAPKFYGMLQFHGMSVEQMAKELRRRAWRRGARSRASFMRWLNSLTASQWRAATAIHKYEHEQLKRWIADPERQGTAPPTGPQRRATHQHGGHGGPWSSAVSASSASSSDDDWLPEGFPQPSGVGTTMATTEPMAWDVHSPGGLGDGRDIGVFCCDDLDDISESDEGDWDLVCSIEGIHHMAVDQQGISTLEGCMGLDVDGLTQGADERTVMVGNIQSGVVASTCPTKPTRPSSPCYDKDEDEDETLVERRRLRSLLRARAGSWLPALPRAALRIRCDGVFPCAAPVASSVRTSPAARAASFGALGLLSRH